MLSAAHHIPLPTTLKKKKKELIWEIPTSRSEQASFGKLFCFCEISVLGNASSKLLVRSCWFYVVHQNSIA